jgi:uncharacterized DUF497 family protein
MPMKIVWDHPKRLANIAKHRLDFASLTEEFFADALVISAKSGRYLAIEGRERCYLRGVRNPRP